MLFRGSRCSWPPFTVISFQTQKITRTLLPRTRPLSARYHAMNAPMRSAWVSLSTVHQCQSRGFAKVSARASRARKRVLNSITVQPDGRSYRGQFSLGELNIPARDFLHLYSFGHKQYQLQAPSILPRQDCIVVNISHVKAVIRSDDVVIFDVHRPAVQHFILYLSDFLASINDSVETPFRPHNDIMSSHQEDRTYEYLSGHRQQLPFEKDDMNEPMDFEFRVLEAILSYVCNKYKRRMQCFDPIVGELLEKLLITKDQIDNEMLYQLLPLKNTLSRIERSTAQLQSLLAELLHTEEDMLEMFLTEKKKRNGILPPAKVHEECELLLESYHREITHITVAAFALRKRIENSQDLMEIALDNARNKMMKVNVHMAMAGCGLSMATVWAGLFGMNLVSGLEDDPSAFIYVSGAALSCTIMIYALSVKWLEGRPDYQRTYDSKQLSSIMHKLGDIQDIVLARDLHSLNKEQFAALLTTATERVIPECDINLLFREFDRDGDGVLTDREIKRFLSDCHSRFYNDS